MDERLKENWNEFENKYKYISSWAIWNSANIDDKKETGNIEVGSIFEDESYKDRINTDYVFIGLNASTVLDDSTPNNKWASFHKQGSNDYKLRYALKGTKYWGAYLTDVIKDLGPEASSVNLSNSADVVNFLSDNPSVIEENIAKLKEELNYFSKKPTLIVMGNAATEIVSKSLTDDYDIVSIPHYAAYISKENYQSKVYEILGQVQAMDFLICCYFGKSKELIDAAIDRAYVDMAAHTMRGFDDTEEGVKEKWTCRYEASRLIKKSLKEYDANTVFVSWHESVINGLQSIYGESRLSYGQAQKWLNMTIKYVYVLRMILGDNDQELFEVRPFLAHTTTSDYYPPIDSYVIKGAEITSDHSWSLMKKPEYESVNKALGTKKGFLWEMANWESFSHKYACPDSKSYAYFLDKKREIAEEM